MRNLITALILSIIGSCINANKQRNHDFSVPKVVFQDTAILDTIHFVSNYIENSYPMFCGKYKNNDTIKFNKNKIFNKYEDTTFRNNRFYTEKTEILDRDSPYLDSMDTEGFNVKADYSQDILLSFSDTEKNNSYFPVFIVNSTTKTKVLIGKDDRIFAIQEAKDKAGNWRPIQWRGTDFCGVGYWGLYIRPSEFSTILFPKYNGDFDTEIRIRFRNGKHVMISNSFKGKINTKQFYFEHRDIELDSYRRYNMDYFFLGGIPIELDSSAKPLPKSLRY
jgi:hypothetical protein